jgi:DNA helicase-2/ATP-dependent DNA helicase PcrA
VCLTRARQRLILTGASRRRIFGDYQPTQPSRFLDEIPPELIDRVEPAAPRWQRPRVELRNPYAKRRTDRVRDDASTGFAYEQEDQSAGPVRAGMRVRHRLFGVGTIMAVEEHDDDYKLTVRFVAAGTKKLLARYAGLEPA